MLTIHFLGHPGWLANIGLTDVPQFNRNDASARRTRGMISQQLLPRFWQVHVHPSHQQPLAGGEIKDPAP
jgi:hypothetical protein